MQSVLISPVMIFKSVDLPQPLGPKITFTLLSSILTEEFSNKTFSLYAKFKLSSLII